MGERHEHPGAPALSSLSQLVFSLEFVGFYLPGGDLTALTPLPISFLLPLGGENTGVYFYTYNQSE